MILWRQKGTYKNHSSEILKIMEKEKEFQYSQKEQECQVLMEFQPFKLILQQLAEMNLVHQIDLKQYKI